VCHFIGNDIKRISPGNQPAGMHMIVVSNNSKLVGHYLFFSD